MVLPVTRFFNKPTSGNKHRPILNNIATSTTQNASRLGGFNSKYNTYWKRFLNSPEMHGIINILVTDIMGDRPAFTGIKGEPLGKDKLFKAQRVWRADRMKETLSAILFDMFVTGDGYGWKAKATDAERAKAIKEGMRKYSLKIKEGDYNHIFIKAMQDEDLKKPKKFDYIASSTVEINSDNYDILGYTQMAYGITNDFKPEEVLHFRLNTVDGKIHGYSPMESLVKELTLLYFSKGNMLSYMQNGGRPEMLYTMENAQPGSDSFNNFQQQLASFKQVENRFGSLLGTGKVDVKDLSFGRGRDLEYQNMSLWVLSIMLFSYGIPISRVPFLIGQSATGGDSGGLAEAGYQSMISSLQDLVEDVFNFQFLEELGFHVRLNRHYKQDEVREAQAVSMNADTVTKIQTIYRSQGKNVKISKINEILGVSDDDLEEMDDDDMMMADPGLRNQNLLDNMSLEKEPDKLKKNDTKRNVANQSANKGAAV